MRRRYESAPYRVLGFWSYQFSLVASRSMIVSAAFLTMLRLRRYLPSFRSAMVELLLNHMNGAIPPPVGHELLPVCTRELSMYHDGTPNPRAAASASWARLNPLLPTWVGQSPPVTGPSRSSGMTPSGQRKT